ncbi:hypothetical protein Desor_2585 [Desulfosporosinus orientis DSM 765]|uniref:Stage 0 sporulation protein A homolog n=1 Tax=Desulfosporosinus orientis (strain ATCC 19365 / DSM 765 / NCIMB 8382 / VKM B-1628 / Singapore I) TaxID=768706 RepID=G7W6C8_DESOD|nr:hypothetical protein Desor_2585 [Desulfosporosinus orientis DSM 765]
MPKLLIVDDDIHLRKLVLTYAELDGFQCEEYDKTLGIRRSCLQKYCMSRKIYGWFP